MRKPFAGDFVITQKFGENPQIYSRFGMEGHNGIDYALPSDTPLLSAISGKVIEPSFDPQGYGNYIKIENDQEGALVAHLKGFNVSLNQQVAEGQLIGYSDNTGFSSGPHLHFGYYRKPRDRSNGYAGYIDPEPYFISSPTPMGNETKKAVQFDRILNYLHSKGYIDNPASELYIEDDKLVGLIGKLYRDYEVAKEDSVDIEAIKKAAYNNAIKDVLLVADKLSKI